MCLDGDFFLSLFLLPVLLFRNYLFFFPHIPAVKYHLLGLLSPSSHSYVLLSKKPCSSPAKSPSFFCNSPFSPICIPAGLVRGGRQSSTRSGSPGDPGCVGGLHASLLLGEGVASISSHTLTFSHWQQLDTAKGISYHRQMCYMGSCFASGLSIRDRDQLKNSIT